MLKLWLTVKGVKTLDNCLNLHFFTLFKIKRESWCIYTTPVVLRSNHPSMLINDRCRFRWSGISWRQDSWHMVRIVGSTSSYITTLCIVVISLNFCLRINLNLSFRNILYWHALHIRNKFILPIQPVSITCLLYL